MRWGDSICLYIFARLHSFHTKFLARIFYLERFARCDPGYAHFLKKTALHIASEVRTTDTKRTGAMTCSVLNFERKFTLRPVPPREKPDVRFIVNDDEYSRQRSRHK
mmetsp:Transcript_36070/g.70970  ORF Transcript_36070/g.70970 Transcript_36070/m.70970 type:complete len:107 (-) Transcript_36070:64-384(-)